MVEEKLYYLMLESCKDQLLRHCKVTFKSLVEVHEFSYQKKKRKIPSIDFKAKEAVLHLQEIASSVALTHISEEFKIDGNLIPSSNVYLARIENNGLIQTYFHSSEDKNDHLRKPRRATNPPLHPEEKIGTSKRSNSTNLKLPNIIITSSSSPKGSSDYKLVEAPNDFIRKNDDNCNTFSAVNKSASLETSKSENSPIKGRYVRVNRRSSVPINNNIKPSSEIPFSINGPFLLKRSSWFNADNHKYYSVKEKLKLIRDSYKNARFKADSHNK
ncbi:unnamed protein product [Blepharisma stoltei]|uniref:Uncharacterized protein n=1 Tax=Blepharisma stoltei TaxID=1481888 RepID=A0AAU9JAD8_9CILI|nr:unnamed protein product [Blepharisma stoltei]